MNPDRRAREEPQRTVDLLDRARRGDGGAWTELYERYSSELHRRVHARLGPELRGAEDSMDVFQSVWREAIGSLNHFEYRGEGSFLAWLATVLRNKLATRAERLHAEKRGGGVRAPIGSEYSRVASDQPASGTGPESRVASDEDRELLHRAIGRLSADHEELVRWSLLDGLSHGEIAERLGIGANAARMRAARASAKLVTELRKLRGGG